MSLIAWYPLNGDFRNQGIGDYPLTKTGTVTSGTRGATFAGGGCLYNSSTELQMTDNFSWSIWTKFTGLTNNGTTWAFTIGRADMAGYGTGLQIASATSVSAWFGNTSKAVTITASVWHNIALTVKGTTVTVYLDGEEAGTFTQSTPPTYVNGAGLGLGCFRYTGSHLYYYTGDIADFRLYNHCLSPKEVKEISHGEILHYPLSHPDGMILGRNLLTKSVRFFDSTNGYEYTFSRGGRLALTKDILAPYVSTTDNTDGRDVTLSFDIKLADGGTSRSLQVYGYQGSGVSVKNSKAVVPTDTWTHFSWTTKVRRFAIGSYSDGTPYTSGEIWIYDPAGSNSYTVKNIKLAIGATETPFTPAEDTSTTVYDVSGFKNNGTVTGTLTAGDSGPGGLLSARFDGASYIAAGKGAKVTDQITVSAWVNPSSWTSPNRIISCTEGGGWNWEVNSGQLSFLLYASSSYRRVLWGTTLASMTSGWHLLTSTYDGKTAKVYLDGVLDGESTFFTTETPITYASANGLFIGAEAADTTTTPTTPYFNGDISDVRIFTTALSAADVKALYEEKFSVANNGTLFCGEIIEVAEQNVKLGRNGVVSANSFSAGTGRENIVVDSHVANRNSSTTSYPAAKYQLSTQVEAGKVYTWSVNLSSSGLSSTACLDVYFGGGTYGTGWVTLGGDVTDKTISRTFTANSNQASMTQIHIYVRQTSSAQSLSGTPVTINWVKIEKGEGASPWCPSAQDTTVVAPTEVDSVHIYDNAIIAAEIIER